MSPFENLSIDLVIFDCDGVLIDSEELSKKTLLMMLGDLGVVVSDEYFETYFLGQNYTTVRAQIYADFSIELPDTFREKYLANLLKTFSKELKPTNKLDRVLDKLQVPSCVATSSSSDRAEFALRIAGLEAYFEDRVFTSSQVKKGKPAPDIFLHAAKHMHVEPKNCLVIEDSQAGILGAKAAGMTVIKYAGAEHLRHKGVLQTDIANQVYTILDWNDFFQLFPALFKSNAPDDKK